MNLSNFFVIAIHTSCLLLFCSFETNAQSKINDSTQVEDSYYFSRLTIFTNPFFIVDQFAAPNVIVEHRLGKKTCLQHFVGVVIAESGMHDDIGQRGFKLKEEFKFTSNTRLNNERSHLYAAIELFYTGLSYKKKSERRDITRYGANLKVGGQLKSDRFLMDLYFGAGLMKARGGIEWLLRNYDNTIDFSMTMGVRIGYVLIK